MGALFVPMRIQIQVNRKADSARIISHRDSNIKQRQLKSPNAIKLITGIMFRHAYPDIQHLVIKAKSATRGIVAAAKIIRLDIKVRAKIQIEAGGIAQIIGSGRQTLVDPVRSNAYAQPRKSLISQRTITGGMPLQSGVLENRAVLAAKRQIEAGVNLVGIRQIQIGIALVILRSATGHRAIIGCQLHIEAIDHGIVHYSIQIMGLYGLIVGGNSVKIILDLQRDNIGIVSVRRGINMPDRMAFAFSAFSRS